jgi:hypothetical protein
MKFSAVLAVFAAFSADAVHGSMTGANEPIADNELGLTAKACAETYCSAKDGLELWLSFSGVCLAAETQNPYLMSKETSAAAASPALWAPAHVGAVSAVVAVAALMAGFAQGVKSVR